jgi:mono/diheme cytochrome c family protein
VGGDAGGAGAPLPARSETAPARAAGAEKAPAAAAPARAPAVVEEPVDLAPAPAKVLPKGPHKLPIPVWVMPVLVAIPLWAFFFPAAFSNHKKAAASDPVTIGNQVYHANCSTCHGTNGEGGVGPALHGGVAAITFPNIQDHIDWVKNGSTGLPKNAPYGDPNRAGGQHVASKNDMPGFGSTLSMTQIQDVVLYERTKL